MPYNPKGWFLTFPQCSADPQSLLDFLRPLSVQAAVVREQHADGNSHLHAYVSLSNPLPLARQNQAFREFGDGDYQPARSVRAVLKYISKENQPLTYNLDLDALVRKQKKTVTAADIKATPALSALESGMISFHSLKSYMFARSLVVPPYDHTGVRGKWFWGPPGTGKSRFAREQYPEFYLKAQNKWFDGYSGEKCIILDDFDLKNVLGHYLKIWADRYACAGEIKGGMVQLQHHVFVVTSNYTIDQMFEDEEMQVAIKRRFEVHHFDNFPSSE